MKTHSFITAFAERYGLKEGIILTELCRQTHITGKQEIPFSAPDCHRQLGYLTEKQIRNAIRSLQEQHCITVCSAASKSFDRTLSYSVDDDVYRIYLEAITASRAYCEQLAIGGY